jgi:hypothetical protein
VINITEKGFSILALQEIPVYSCLKTFHHHANIKLGRKSSQMGTLAQAKKIRAVWLLAEFGARNKLLPAGKKTSQAKMIEEALTRFWGYAQNFPRITTVIRKLEILCLRQKSKQK